MFVTLCKKGNRAANCNTKEEKSKTVNPFTQVSLLNYDKRGEF